MTIRRLPDDIISAIRAGEVIDRPVSVVRELLDNALDAGAGRIRIEMDQDGRFITVEDDGVGISPEDLIMVTEKHATSKFRSLDTISTLGFRGEAMSSIAYVADVTITSRVHNAPGAYSFDSVSGSVKPASGRGGTFVMVRNLFRDFPVRRNALKSGRHECSLIVSEVRNAAICHNDVAFMLVDGKGRELINVRGSNRRDRIGSMIGHRFIENAIHIRGCNDVGHEFDLYAALPTYGGHHKTGQHIFVNGRSVRYREVRDHLAAAYSGLCKERNPSFVIVIDSPTHLVDCNVHAQKREVMIAGIDAMMKEISGRLRQEFSSLHEPARSASVRASEFGKITEKTLVPEAPRVVGIFKGNFAITITKDGIGLTDLHAIHERVVLQRLMKSYETKAMDVREIPVLDMRLSPDDFHIADLWQEKIQEIGFHYMLHGDHVISITHIPALFTGDTRKCMDKILDLIHDNSTLDLKDTILSEIMGNIACHNAFRTGDDIDIEAAQEIINQAYTHEFTAQCNHGRPTNVMFSEDDINRMFHRT